MIIDRDNITLASICQNTNLQNKTVLEIGCGDGRISKDLVGQAKKLVALDYNLAAVTKAHKHMQGACLLNGSGEYLPFGNGCFDVILFTLSLHHQCCAIALREAARVLKEGGTVIVIEPVADAELEQLCHLFDDETPVLNRARQAIDQSDFAIVDEKVIYPVWQTDSAQELYHWLFNYYDVPYSADKIAEIDNFLGQKILNQPLSLQDKLSICRLQKPV